MYAPASECGETEEVRSTMANESGKIYLCSKCGSQFIVTKGGEGSLKCCGVEMQKK